MKLIDSSGWIEYFRGTDLGKMYREHVRAGDLLVPTVVMLEVYKILRRDDSQEAADMATAQLQKATVVDLDATLALYAAELSLQHQLAMADAIIYATALQNEAELVTSDRHLGVLTDVTYLEKSE